jgi:hypothetical protein
MRANTMTRCRYSEDGLKSIRPQSGQREGTVIYEMEDGERVVVRWDGNKTVHQIHKDFIEVIPDLTTMDTTN